MTKILDVSYFSQLSKGAEYYTNDCLAAVFRMVWGYTRIQAGKQDLESVTVNDFSRDIYQSTMSLGGILDVYKLKSPRRIPYQPISKVLFITRIQQEIDNGWPVITLGLYNHIRPTQKPIGHFVAVVGYDEDKIIYHDPYYPIDCEDGLSCGAFRSVNQLDFNKFLNPGPNPYFSNMYQGLVHK